LLSQKISQITYFSFFKVVQLYLIYMLDLLNTKKFTTLVYEFTNELAASTSRHKNYINSKLKKEIRSI